MLLLGTRVQVGWGSHDNCSCGGCSRGVGGVQCTTTSQLS
jgi:hypothetical protein